jgi:hypothetical protein
MKTIKINGIEFESKENSEMDFQIEDIEILQLGKGAIDCLRWAIKNGFQQYDEMGCCKFLSIGPNFDFAIFYEHFRFSLSNVICDQQLINEAIELMQKGENYKLEISNQHNLTQIKLFEVSLDFKYLDEIDELFQKIK